MLLISYTAAREKLAKTMEQVCTDHQPVLITRSKSEPVIMISLKDYKQMKETNYLLKNPANTQRIAMAMDEIEAMVKKNRQRNKKRPPKKKAA